ncbi:hypothetical protein HOLleu_21235 [Holothuria leucospilota]|uniref:Uncharacterized protein n=1 Tax=Holothuria leucospilota TaxID=206669 RepID=A0A9Q1H6P1_HOLLE|nr:hypothetical protein HOLleu_21235 [Holothuria leucospilota]
MLVIPPNALPAGKEKHTVQLRYIPRSTMKDQSECFFSNSTTIVEILPNLTLQCPARLSLPHYLVLQQNVERKARIFVSHHEKGTQPLWKEQKHVSYHVEDTDCVIMLNTFSWCTYVVDDTIVKAKKLVVYAAAGKPQKQDKTVRIEVGCYIDFPEKKKVGKKISGVIRLHSSGQCVLKINVKVPPQCNLNYSNGYFYVTLP